MTFPTYIAYYVAKSMPASIRLLRTRLLSSAATPTAGHACVSFDTPPFVNAACPYSRLAHRHSMDLCLAKPLPPHHFAEEKAVRLRETSISIHHRSMYARGHANDSLRPHFVWDGFAGSCTRDRLTHLLNLPRPTNVPIFSMRYFRAHTKLHNNRSVGHTWLHLIIRRDL